MLSHRVGLTEVRKFLSRLNSKEVLLRAKSLFSYVDAHRQQFVGFEEFEQLYNNAIYVKLVGGAVGSGRGKVGVWLWGGVSIDSKGGAVKVLTSLED